MTREELRLQEAQRRTAHWRRWGPYLAERQWGTVREDYSGDGDAWSYFSHDQARSRAYRWGEDGIAGVSDDRQRLCFALASEYGGAALGPAQLDISRCFEDNSLEAIMKLVLREGCVGETVAALEALEAAAVAHDPALKRVLLRIAQDEQAHAELAFKFLAWAVTRSSLESRTELEHEARRALDDFEAAALARPAEPRGDSAASDGILGTEALRAIHLGAVREVVEPLLAALLNQPTSAHRAGSAPSPA